MSNAPPHFKLRTEHTTKITHNLGS